MKKRKKIWRGEQEEEGDGEEGEEMKVRRLKQLRSKGQLKMRRRMVLNEELNALLKMISNQNEEIAALNEEIAALKSKPARKCKKKADAAE